MRSLRSQLLDTVYPGDGTTLADIGIQTDRYGKLVFDAEKFATAYAADGDRRHRQADRTFAARIQEVANDASDRVDGTITTAISGRTTGIDRLNDSIEAWDDRLELRRTSAHPAVHRPRDGPEPDEQPVQLAVRPDQVASLSNSSGS